MTFEEIIATLSGVHVNRKKFEATFVSGGVNLTPDEINPDMPGQVSGGASIGEDDGLPMGGKCLRCNTSANVFVYDDARIHVAPFSVFIAFKSTTGDVRFLTHKWSGAGQGWAVAINTANGPDQADNAVAVWFGADSNNWLTFTVSPGLLTDGNWHTIGVSILYDPDTRQTDVSVYFDGVLSATASEAADPTNNTYPMGIGFSPFLGGQTDLISLDEHNFFAAGLDGGTFAALHTAAMTPAPTPPAGYVATALGVFRRFHRAIVSSALGTFLKN